MQQRDLVLVGGGHTHALIIRRLGMKPLTGVRVTLISEQTMTPYSGMLPGFVAGHYSNEETHIDLNQLCQWASVRWIRATVTGVDAEAKVIHLRDRSSFSYDKISFDTGSTPDLSVPGASEFAIGVKPVSRFRQTLDRLLALSEKTTSKEWGVIGAGAGGVELVLALAHRLRNKPELKFHLAFSGPRVLAGYPEKLVEHVERAMHDHGISLHSDFRVARVSASGIESSGGELLPLDQSIWCTGAAAPGWLRGSSLQLSEDGFIAVNQHLQSVSHTDVFAVGDVADMLHDPRPKAGVYAVRQAPFLYDNLARAFTTKPLRTVKLQTDFLSLISLGEKQAVGCRFGVTAAGSWVWRWKDSIDRKFMNRLNQPGPRPSMGRPPTMSMHCAGCGSKLGPDLIRDSLSRLPVYARPDIVPALGHAEDAAVIKPAHDQLMLQSIDGFRTFTTDLESFGRICVLHALSDIYAMGATPIAAQVWINLAHNHPRLNKRDYQRLMGAIAATLEAEQTTLSGGHSTEGIETHVGIVATGQARADHLWRKHTAAAGDLLVLTKPLGTGVILAADMQLAAPAAAIEAAFVSMQQSNRSAAQALKAHRPAAVTDVTGFGLLGHLLEMLAGTELGAELNVAHIAPLDGAIELLEQGFQSTLQPHLLANTAHCQIDEKLTPARLNLLLDPQTSGGLLVALNPATAAKFVAAVPQATVIGRITDDAVVSLLAD